MPHHSAGSDRPLPPPAITRPASRSYHHSGGGRLAPPFYRGGERQRSPRPGMEPTSQPDAALAAEPALPRLDTETEPDVVLAVESFEPQWDDATAGPQPDPEEGGATEAQPTGVEAGEEQAEAAAGEFEAPADTVEDAAFDDEDAAFDDEDAGSLGADLAEIAGDDASPLDFELASAEFDFPPGLDAFALPGSDDAVAAGGVAGEGRELAERVAVQLEDLARDVRANGIPALGHRSSAGELARLIAAVVAGFYAHER